MSPRANDTSDTKCAERLFDVIPAVMQLIRQEARATVKNQLTVPQFRVLGRLSRNISNNGELAEWIGVSLPAMSKMVDLLVNRGLIQREVHSTDRRQVKLSLTAKGLQLHNNAKAETRCIFAGKIRKLSEEKRLVLLEALGILQYLFVNSEEIHESPISVSRDRERAERMRTTTNFAGKG